MNTIIYINNEQCSTLEQLIVFFQSAKPLNLIYYDLLDYGRNKELSNFLQEIGESEKANSINVIPSELNDSDYFSSMMSIILGTENKISLKPDIFDCLSLEDVKCIKYNDKLCIKIEFKVVIPINESYDIVVQTGWGTRSMKLILKDTLVESQFIHKEIEIRKKPGYNLGKVSLYLDEHKKLCDVIENAESSGNQDLEDSASDEIKNIIEELKINNAPNFLIELAQFCHRMDIKNKNTNENETTERQNDKSINNEEEDNYSNINISENSNKRHYRWQTPSFYAAIENDKKERERKLAEMETEKKKKEEEATIAKWKRRHGIN